MVKQHLDYFSEKELKQVNAFKRFRTTYLYPIARVLVKMGCTADFISFIGFLMIFGFVYFIEKNPTTAVIFILLHIIFDGLDGPIARISKKDGSKGAFIDIIADHTGIIIATLGFMYYGLVQDLVGGIYIYLYTIMIVFTIIRNIMKIRPRLVIRSKWMIYILFIIYAFTNINYLNEAMILFSILMFISVSKDLIVIREKL